MCCRVVAALALFSVILPTSGESAKSRFLAVNSGSPIDGSQNWATCWHTAMHTCGHQCCCDAGFVYDGDDGACVEPFDPIDGSHSWISCWHPGMYTCHHKCCCMSGYEYDAGKIACVMPSNEDEPGFQFLGFGYDVLTGNPLFTTGTGDEGIRTNIFAFSHENGLRTPDGKWKIPDKTTTQAVSACSTEHSVNIINSMFAYQHTVGASFEFDFPLFGAAFTFGVDAKTVRTNTYSDEYLYALVQSTCAVYDITMHMSDATALHPNFVKGVSALPANYDEDAYMLFIQQFGTHVIFQITLGGRWGWQLQFENRSYQALLDDSVDINLGIQMGASVKAGIDITLKKDETETKVMEAIYKNASFNVGGDFKVDVKDWEESVRNKPMPLKMSLFDLYNLFTDTYLPDVTDLERKRENMKNASNQYCAYRKAHVDPHGSCVTPVVKPKSQPTPVVCEAIRRICVQNHGAYAMWLETTSTDNRKFNTDSYPNPQDRCVDGMQLGLKGGEPLHCKAHIIAGTTPDCTGGDYKFDSRSNMQANYRCEGSTMSNTCFFIGLSAIG